MRQGKTAAVGRAPALTVRTAVAACGLGIGLWACCGRWLPGTAQARPQLQTQDQPKPRGCQAALVAGVSAFEEEHAGWIESSEGGQLISNFGKVSAAAEQKALNSFIRALENEEAGTCTQQRFTLLALVHQQTWTSFLAQRKLAEEYISQTLTERLLQGMKHRGARLRVQEKVGMLRGAVDEYKGLVDNLLPSWTPDEAASNLAMEHDEAARRLGALQFRIEDSGAGQALASAWERKNAERAMGKRAHGLSVSFDPALHVMIRPEGLGNLQVFSSGTVGPPNSPAQVDIGILNDGSIADVYREHPVPALFAMQPAVKVNVNLR